MNEKVKQWFNDARSTYVFIHWQDQLKLKPKLKLVKNTDMSNDTCTLEVTKCKLMKKAI